MNPTSRWGLTLAAALTLSVFSPAQASSSTPAWPTSTSEGRPVVHADTVPPVSDLGPTSFSETGPFPVGEATIALKTNGAPVEVWYPTTAKAAAGKSEARYDLVSWLPPFIAQLVPEGFSVGYGSGGVRGVRVAPGRFPLVVFSHGFAGFRDQSSFLTSALASWGFIVAAPDHYSRDLTKVLGGPVAPTATTDVGDLRATITLLSKMTGWRSSRFHQHVDTRRIGAVGHSAGGAAVEALAAADNRVDTFVGMAGATVGAFGETEAGPGSVVPRKPGLLMAATVDAVVEPYRIRNAYRKLRKPKRFLLVGGGHHAFSELCEIGDADGGLLAIAEAIGIPIPDTLVRLASDGCDPPALPPTQAWPAIRHATVAHLRHVFGFDRSDAGLSDLTAAYPGVVEQSLSVPAR